MATPMSLQPSFQISVYDDVVYAQTWEVLGTLRSDDGDDNENVKKAIGLIQFCKSITLYCTFLSRHCTTTTWKCLTVVQMENTSDYEIFLLFLNLDMVLRNSTLDWVHLHLTKLVTWSNRDEDWKNKNSLFQQRFRCRRRPRILRSLLTPKNSIKPL